MTGYSEKSIICDFYIDFTTVHIFRKGCRLSKNYFFLLIFVISNIQVQAKSLIYDVYFTKHNDQTLQTVLKINTQDDKKEIIASSKKSWVYTMIEKGVLKQYQHRSNLEEDVEAIAISDGKEIKFTLNKKGKIYHKKFKIKYPWLQQQAWMLEDFVSSDTEKILFSTLVYTRFTGIRFPVLVAKKRGQGSIQIKGQKYHTLRITLAPRLVGYFWSADLWYHAETGLFLKAEIPYGLLRPRKLVMQLQIEGSN